MKAKDKMFGVGAFFSDVNQLNEQYKYRKKEKSSKGQMRNNAF